MTSKVVLLLEEPSMKILLDALLPQIMPGWIAGQHFQCIAHEGKSDLEASIPRKLKAWQEPGVRFMVVRDNDGADCIQLKAHYTALCQRAGRPDTLVRLVCQELESWYLGDLIALAAAYGKNLDTPAYRKRYALPDTLTNAKQELRRVIAHYQPISGSRAIAPHMAAPRNRSHSFHVFVRGLQHIAAQ